MSGKEAWLLSLRLFGLFWWLQDKKVPFQAVSLLWDHMGEHVSLITALCFIGLWEWVSHILQGFENWSWNGRTIKRGFNRIIEIAYPHVKSVHDRTCERAMVKKKAKGPFVLGRWEWAVTSSDGCWLIRSFHSQCCTFAIIDFLSGGSYVCLNPITFVALTYGKEPPSQ